MTGLLDTHTFLWWMTDPGRLSAAADAFIRDPANVVLLSAASVWEAVIKVNAGKLKLGTPITALVNRWVGGGGRVLDVRLDHALAGLGLPNAHKDPFDRVLVAQARVEGAAVLTVDAIFQQYPVRVVW